LEENKLTPYSQKPNELLSELKTNQQNGLSSAEVLAKKEKYGANKLREKKKKTTMQRFLDQFKDAMILILIAAAIISFVVVCVEQNWGELFEPVLIVLIVILNAVMGVYQEGKAEKALDALKNMSAPHARVIRDGEEKIIDASELVPGDMIHLEAGDFVPADARLLHSAGLKSEESALTGESVPSEKDYQAIVKEGAPLGDRHNMVYSGCSITYGTATAVVTATGMDTEMGKIANMLDNEEDGQTPLQQKLTQLGKYLGIVALAACAIIFVVGLINGIPVLAEQLERSFAAAEDAATAIMTTDTKKKEFAVTYNCDGNIIKIGGMCKGSGMIQPNMATMLGFITTDVAITPELLQKALSTVIADTFNMVSVDGDTSTNDMVTVLASGMACEKVIDEENYAYDAFLSALGFICTKMCTAIAADGEGATKLLTADVRNYRDIPGAKKLAKSVINSSLVKTAMYGADANWGRILCALGYAGVDIDTDKIDVRFTSRAGSILVCENGRGYPFDEDEAKKILLEHKVTIDIDMKDGAESARAWGCDLSYEYVRINGDYRS